ncbi:hypothetical protein [Nocardioides sp. SR21]|uniref:hypothetical protein n=1 Tax=Nocardioides sp. SR21 TaxID=2919501 RepID=UPI001FA9E426|nr:hypothetical protein [Nocardioides sp. SR21]
MSDLNPPPDEPLPDQSRARMRAELLETAQAPSRSRRWLVPAGVAAAVVLVAALTAWAVQLGPGEESGGPAVAPTSAPTPEPTPEPEPTATGPEDPDDPGDHWAGHGPCAQELRHPLPGAELAASFDEHTSFWVKGDRFALCDQRDRTTVQGPRSLEPAEQVDTYAVSSVYTASGEVTRVAGGVVPDGAMAFDVAYTFPDGQTVRAETTEGGGHTWWRVVHTYETAGNEMKQPPIEVTVSYSGVQEHYALDWGPHTCAQVNHGC